MLESFLNPRVIIPIIVVIIGYLLFYFRRKKKRQSNIPQDIRKETPPHDEGGNGEQPEVTYEPQEARIYNSITRTVYNATISGGEVAAIVTKYSTLGRKWNRDGKQLYALDYNADRTYSPRIMPITPNNPPSKLHRALNHPGIALWFNVQRGKNFVEKWGWAIAFAVGAFFCIWVAIQGK